MIKYLLTVMFITTGCTGSVEIGAQEVVPPEEEILVSNELTYESFGFKRNDSLGFAIGVYYEYVGSYVGDPDDEYYKDGMEGKEFYAKCMKERPVLKGYYGRDLDKYSITGDSFYSPEHQKHLIKVSIALQNNFVFYNIYNLGMLE